MCHARCGEAGCLFTNNHVHVTNTMWSRPIRLIFDTKKDKHFFLKHASHLEEVGLKYNDDLTRSQQSERQDLSADFSILTTKGHKPSYRGSSLMFRHADKLCTCKRNGANTASVVPGLVQVPPLYLPLAPTPLMSTCTCYIYIWLWMMTRTKMNDCIVFVCEFIDLDSCLVGPRRYPEQWVCLFLCLTSNY